MSFDKIVAMQRKGENRIRVERFLEPYSDLTCKLQDIVLWLNPVVSAVFCLACFLSFHALYALCVGIPPLCLLCLCGIAYIVWEWVSTAMPGVLSLPLTLVDKLLPQATSNFNGSEDNTVVGNVSMAYDYATTLYAAFSEWQPLLKALSAFALAYFLFFVPTPLLASIVFTFVMSVPALIYHDIPNKVQESLNNSSNKNKRD